MADAQGIMDEYGYAVWAWSAPEEMNLTKPGDWDENDESLERQTRRWETDQKRRKQKGKW